MVSLLVHAVLGFFVIAWIVASNAKVFARPAGGPLFSPMEVVYYLVGIASVALGWYFNITFVQQYSHGSTNPLWGEHGSWAEYIRLMFTNPAASSASQDYTIANVVLLPLFTIVDGYRRGLRRPGCTSCPACSPASRSRSPSTSRRWNASAGTSRPARRCPPSRSV